MDPVLAEPGLGSPNRDPSLGSLDLGLERVLLVRLAQVEQLLGDLLGFLGVLSQQTFVLDRPLGREDVEVRGGQPVHHLQPLGVCLDLRQFGFLLVLLPAESELPSGHDLLLEREECPLSGPPCGSDLLADDTGGGVERETGLEGLAAGRIDVRRGLDERRVVRESELF